MITAVWALLCKHASITPDGELEIRGEFNGASFKAFPAMPPRLYYVARLYSDKPVTVRLDARIVAPSGDILVFDESPKIEAQNGHIRYIRGFENIVYPTPGVYSFEILRDNNLIHSCKLSMNLDVK